MVTGTRVEGYWYRDRVLGVGIYGYWLKDIGLLVERQGS